MNLVGNVAFHPKRKRATFDLNPGLTTVLQSMRLKGPRKSLRNGCNRLLCR